MLKKQVFLKAICLHVTYGVLTNVGMCKMLCLDVLNVMCKGVDMGNIKGS